MRVDVEDIVMLRSSKLCYFNLSFIFMADIKIYSLCGAQMQVGAESNLIVKLFKWNIRRSLKKKNVPKTNGKI